MRLFTAAEMREADRRTTEEYGIPGIVLMENAGQAVARAVQEVLDRNADAFVRIFAGRGNNGGDGLVAARYLHARGADVVVLLLCAGEELHGDAAANYAAAKAQGVEIIEQPSPEDLEEAAAEADVVVDAILGTGLSGEVRDLPLAAIQAINRGDGHVVAVDIPSGISSDTGAVLGDCVHADVTVTFGAAKVGLYTFPGRTYAGEVRVADIGIPAEVLAEAGGDTYLTTPELAANCLPRRSPVAHKGTYGRVLVVGGSVGMTGAAAMAAEAALRGGAGLVYLACPESLNDILEVKLTEVITRPLPETADRTLGREALAPLQEMLDGISCVVLGPGLSTHRETQQLVWDLVREITCPLVVDADGLNALAADPSRPVALGHTGAVLTSSTADTAAVLTPHPGEMARLLGWSVEEVQADRLAAARRAAQMWQAVVVLKGPGTVIAGPAGTAWINPTGNEGMATAGSGDVLSGLTGALLGGGIEVRYPRGQFRFRAEEAAVAAAFYHGRAGDLAARELGTRGMIAGDILRHVPAALKGQS